MGKRKLVHSALAAWLVTAIFAVLLPTLMSVRAEAITEVAKLVAADAAREDQFGISVAIDGDTVVVGARLRNVDGKSNAGSAYVFRYEGTAWGQEQ